MIRNPEIHLVSFTIPYPANYGGVIDVFYKIKKLYELGVIINLHCFKYDRNEAKELKKYCKTVNYYPRPKNLKYFFSKIPFIVITRSNKMVLESLQKDTYPILFEGLHTTFFLKNLIHQKRNIVVRTHNIEHDYYKNLGHQEKNIFRKIFFYSEAFKLKNYEKILTANINIAGITERDCNHFKSLNSRTFLIEAFHEHSKINITDGKGNYVLFHGNLSVNENIRAAEFIINKICSKINFNFKFAGKNPTYKLHKLADKYHNVEIIANPTESQMNNLIQNAHINLLVSFQNTGIKLKLINALYMGRHCVVNNKMVESTKLESACHICDNHEEIILKLTELIKIPFSYDEINKREQILLKNVNNEHNAQKLINLLV